MTTVLEADPPDRERDRQSRLDWRARREAKRAAKAEAEVARRTEAALAERAFQAYLQFRDRLRAMQACSPPPGDLTEIERRTIAALQPMWDASPAMIAQLRHLCGAISGVHASDYVDPSKAREMRLRRDVGRLRRMTDDTYFVPEPPALGGFGVTRNRVLFNQDTARFFNALVALDDGALLGGLRAGARPVVWEAGGGWGGFAYQFKTVCPASTYVITGMAETCLVAAVYLATMFPSARFRVFGETPVDTLWDDWEQIDFYVIPETVLETIRPPRLDLLIDVMRLRHMTEARVVAHLAHAFEAGCRYVYSLRGRGLIDETPSVWRAIERWYWPHEMPTRVEVMPLPADPTDPNAEEGYEHLVGWRRLRV